MAKEKREKKHTKVGAAFGSIGFTILTFLVTLLFFGSVTMHVASSSHAFSKAVEQTDLSQVKVMNFSLSEMMYDDYFWDCPTLSGMDCAVSDQIMTSDAVNAFYADFLRNVEDFWNGDADKIEFITVQEYGDAVSGTVTLEQADYDGLTYTMEDDFNAWNQTLGKGLTKNLIHFYVSKIGMIFFGVVEFIVWLCWLICAITKKWRKSRMMTAFGLIIFIPFALITIATGVGILAFDVLEIPNAAEEIGTGVATLGMPFFLTAVGFEVGGLVFSLIGMWGNKSVKAKKQAQSGSSTEGEYSYQAAEPATEIKSKKEVETDATGDTGKICPNCGNTIPAGSDFCGACGTSLKS